MGEMASRITGLTIVYSTADQRKHQSAAPLAFVRGIHRWPVNSPHKRPITRKMFPFNDVIMKMPVRVVLKIWWNTWAIVPGMYWAYCAHNAFLWEKINGRKYLIWRHINTSNGFWCIGIKGEMSGTVCVTFTWDIYIYIRVVYSFCLFCCLFIIVTWWYMWCIVWQVASKRKYRHVW